jgi:eukaryotic-like serine/threonine-protein kinase
MADSPENVIDGYTILTSVATSATSEILEVQEPGSNRRLAMKLLNTEHPDFKEHRLGLKKEAGIAKQLDHPNLIKFVGYSAGRDHTYMLMEYFRAPNVKLQLKIDMNSVHMRLKKLMEGVCAALSHMHEKGWVHRDIKPDNVLMNKAGEVKVIDFSLSEKARTGLSKLMGGKVSSIQGTRTYIAPETIRKRPAVFQTDMYSVGIMLFEILTGRTPFQGATPNDVLQKHLTAEAPNPSELNPNVAPEMDRLVQRLLSKKPDQRGTTMVELAAELKRTPFFKEEPVEKKKDSDAAPSKDMLDQLADARLDSRLDAKRSQVLRDNPELKVELERKIKDRQEQEAARKAERAARVAKGSGAAAETPAAPPIPVPMAQPTIPPAMMPMMMPGYPGGQMMPGMGYPPGMSMPPGMPMSPGMGMAPGMTMAPGMGMPSGMPMAPGVPMTPPMGMPPGTPAVPTAPNPASRPNPQTGGPPRGLPAGAAPNVGAGTVPAVGTPTSTSTPSPPVAARPTAASPTRPPAVAPASPAKAVPPAASRPPAAQPAQPAANAEELDFMTELPDIL